MEMTNDKVFKSPVDGREIKEDEWCSLDSESRVYATSDSGFVFNVFGCCLNPHEEINIVLGKYKAEIRSFEYHGKWGNDICLMTGSAGCMVGTYFCKYSSEKEAIFGGLKYARKWFTELADHNASKIIKEISSLIERYNPKQLELF